MVALGSGRGLRALQHDSEILLYAVGPCLAAVHVGAWHYTPKANLFFLPMAPDLCANSMVND